MWGVGYLEDFEIGAAHFGRVFNQFVQCLECGSWLLRPGTVSERAVISNILDIRYPQANPETEPFPSGMHSANAGGANAKHNRTSAVPHKSHRRQINGS